MAAVDRMVFWTARTTDATSATMTTIPGYNDYTLVVTGVPNGATVTLQASADNSTFVAIGTSTTVTTATHVNFQTATPYIRAVISGSGGSTSLTVAVFS